MELAALRKEKERIWNVDVMNIPMDEIIMRIEKDVSSGEISQTIVCANPHSLAVANKDVEFLEVFKKSPYVIPDGMGIVLASRLLGGRIKQRVTGPDLLEKLADRWSKNNFGSFFFLGSTPHTLDLLKKSLLERFPGLPARHTPGVRSRCCTRGYGRFHGRETPDKPRYIPGGARKETLRSENFINRESGR